MIQHETPIKILRNLRLVRKYPGGQQESQPRVLLSQLAPSEILETQAFVFHGVVAIIQGTSWETVHFQIPKPRMTLYSCFICMSTSISVREGICSYKYWVAPRHAGTCRNHFKGHKHILWKVKKTYQNQWNHREVF